MTDVLEMDASGCWIRKKTQVTSEAQSRLHNEHYYRVVYHLDATDIIDDERKDEDTRRNV